MTVMWMHTKSMEKEITNLTLELSNVTAQLEQEIERGKRVEEIAARMEQGEVERQKQLRRFERNLQELSANDKELRSVLRTIVPPSALRGLRSYKNSGDNATVNGVPRP